MWLPTGNPPVAVRQSHLYGWYRQIPLEHLLSTKAHPQTGQNAVRASRRVFSNVACVRATLMLFTLIARHESGKANFAAAFKVPAILDR